MSNLKKYVLLVPPVFTYTSMFVARHNTDQASDTNIVDAIANLMKRTIDRQRWCCKIK